MAARTRKPPKRITLERLRNVAVAYVQRYGGSARRLEQVLAGRVERSLRYHDELARRDEVNGWVVQVVSELRARGLSDDRRNARALAIEDSLLGRPSRAIRQRLRAKGYEPAAIEAALSALDAQEDPDWVACCRFARRRKLGPFRSLRSQPRSREQELGALMRAGFGYALARRVVEAESQDVLQAVIDDAPVPRLA